MVGCPRATRSYCKIDCGQGRTMLPAKKAEHDKEVQAANDLLSLLICGPQPPLPYDFVTWRYGEYLLAHGWAAAGIRDGICDTRGGRVYAATLGFKGDTASPILPHQSGDPAGPCLHSFDRG